MSHPPTAQDRDSEGNAMQDRFRHLDESTKARYEGLSRDELIARLTLAEPVCALLGWTAARGDTPRDKALHELWSRWVDATPDSGPKGWPGLNDDLIADLAAKRDATREATLRRYFGEPSS